MKINKVGIALATLLASSTAWSHGYVMDPPSRAELCKLGENKCGNAERFLSDAIISLKGSSDFGASGTIASADNEMFDELNNESHLWKTTAVGKGPLDISWQLTKPLRITAWKYYLTKPQWQNALSNHRLTRESFSDSPFCEIPGDALQDQQGLITHKCKLPETQGHQVIYAVADIASDQGQKAQHIANVVDVEVIEGQQHSNAAVHSIWQKEIGTIDRLVRNETLSLQAGDVVRVRFFDNTTEEIKREIQVTVLAGEETNWSEAVANTINQKYRDVRAGVMQKNGDVQVSKTQVNSIYVNSGSALQHVEITVN